MCLCNEFHFEYMHTIMQKITIKIMKDDDNDNDGGDDIDDEDGYD